MTWVLLSMSGLRVEHVPHSLNGVDEWLIKLRVPDVGVVVCQYLPILRAIQVDEVVARLGAGRVHALGPNLPHRAHLPCSSQLSSVLSQLVAVVSGGHVVLTRNHHLSLLSFNGQIVSFILTAVQPRGQFGKLFCAFHQSKQFISPLEGVHGGESLTGLHSRISREADGFVVDVPAGAVTGGVVGADDGVGGAVDEPHADQDTRDLQESLHPPYLITIIDRPLSSDLNYPSLWPQSCRKAKFSCIHLQLGWVYLLLASGSAQFQAFNDPDEGLGEKGVADVRVAVGEGLRLFIKRSTAIEVDEEVVRCCLGRVETG